MARKQKQAKRKKQDQEEEEEDIVVGQRANDNNDLDVEKPCHHMLQLLNYDSDLIQRFKPIVEATELKCADCDSLESMRAQTGSKKPKKAKVKLKGHGKKVVFKPPPPLRVVWKDFYFCLHCGGVYCDNHYSQHATKKNKGGGTNKGQYHPIFLPLSHMLEPNNLQVYCGDVECMKRVIVPWVGQGMEGDMDGEELERYYEAEESWKALHNLWNHLLQKKNNFALKRALDTIRARKDNEQRAEERHRNNRRGRNRKHHSSNNYWVQLDRLKDYQLTGLQNIGNTCFYNSVLQVLYQTIPLLDCLVISRRPDFVSAGMLTIHLAAVLQKMQDSVGSVINPKGLFTQISMMNPRFASWEQQDAQELFLCLLDGVEHEQKKLHIKQQQEELKKKAEHEEKGSKNEAEDDSKVNEKPENPPNLVHQIFGGTFHSNITCLSCQQESSSTEVFNTISVALDTPTKDKPKQEVTLQSCLERFFGTELLDGENGYICSKCNAEAYKKRQEEEQALAAKREAELQKEIEEEKNTNFVSVEDALQANEDVDIHEEDEEEEDEEEESADENEEQEEGSENERSNDAAKHQKGHSKRVTTTPTTAEEETNTTPGPPETTVSTTADCKNQPLNNTPENSTNSVASSPEVKEGVSDSGDHNEKDQKEKEKDPSLKTDAEKKMSIMALPNILVIQCVRFYQTDDGAFHKNTSKVKFDMVLSLKDFLHPNCNTESEMPYFKPLNMDILSENHILDLQHQYASQSNNPTPQPQHQQQGRDRNSDPVFQEYLSLVDAILETASDEDKIDAWDMAYHNAERALNILMDGITANQRKQLKKRRAEAEKREANEQKRQQQQVNDMKSMITTNSNKPENVTVNRTKPDSLTYQLYSIVEHSGSINGGHYVAYLKKFDPSTGARTDWFRCSDSIISKVSEAEVLQTQPYLLFYERL